MKIFRRIWARHDSLMLLHDSEVCSSSGSWSSERIYCGSWTMDISASGRSFRDACMPKRRRDVQMMWSIFERSPTIFLGKAHE